MANKVKLANGKTLRIKSARQWAKSSPEDFVASMLGLTSPLYMQAVSVAALAAKRDKR